MFGEDKLSAITGFGSGHVQGSRCVCVCMEKAPAAQCNTFSPAHTLLICKRAALDIVVANRDGHEKSNRTQEVPCSSFNKLHSHAVVRMSHAGVALTCNNMHKMYVNSHKASVIQLSRHQHISSTSQESPAPALCS